MQISLYSAECVLQQKRFLSPSDKMFILQILWQAWQFIIQLYPHIYIILKHMFYKTDILLLTY